MALMEDLYNAPWTLLELEEPDNTCSDERFLIELCQEVKRLRTLVMPWHVVFHQLEEMRKAQLQKLPRAMLEERVSRLMRVWWRPGRREGVSSDAVGAHAQAVLSPLRITEGRSSLTDVNDLEVLPNA